MELILVVGQGVFNTIFDIGMAANQLLSTWAVSESNFGIFGMFGM